MSSVTNRGMPANGKMCVEVVKITVPDNSSASIRSKVVFPPLPITAVMPFIMCNCSHIFINPPNTAMFTVGRDTPEWPLLRLCRNSPPEVIPPCNHVFIIVLYHICHTEKILTSLDRYAIIIGSNRYSLQNTTKINGGKRHVSRDTRCGRHCHGDCLAAVPRRHSSGADRPAAANVDPPHGMLFGSDSIGRNSR